MDPILQESELEEVYEKCDTRQSRFDSITDLFIGEFPIENGVKRVVEAELTHPNGFGTVLDLEDLARTIASEWVSDNLPNPATMSESPVQEWYSTVHRDIVRKLTNKYYSQLVDSATPVYKDCVRDYIDDFDSRFPTVLDEASKTEQPDMDEANQLIEKHI